MAIGILAPVLERLRRVAPSVIGVFLVLVFVSGSGDAASRPLSADSGPLQRLVDAPLGIAAIAYAGETRLYVSGETLWRLTPEGRPLRVARLPISRTRRWRSPATSSRRR